MTLIYESKRQVWANSLLGPAEREANIRTMYQKDGRIKKYDDAWTEEDQDYYRILVQEYRRVWLDMIFVTALVEHWRTYESKHHKKSYKRKISSVLHDKEEEEWSKSDLLVEEGESYVFPEEHATAEEDLVGKAAV